MNEIRFLTHFQHFLLREARAIPFGWFVTENVLLEFDLCACNVHKSSSIQDKSINAFKGSFTFPSEQLQSERNR